MALCLRFLFLRLVCGLVLGFYWGLVLSDPVSIIDYLAFELLEQWVAVLEEHVSLLMALVDEFVLKEGAGGDNLHTYGCGGSC